MLTRVTVKTQLKPKTAHEKSLSLRVLEPTFQPPDHPECKDLVLTGGGHLQQLTHGWSISIRGSDSSTFLEDNLLGVFLR